MGMLTRARRIRRVLELNWVKQTKHWMASRYQVHANLLANQTSFMAIILVLSPLVLLQIRSSLSKRIKTTHSEQLPRIWKWSEEKRRGARRNLRGRPFAASAGNLAELPWLAASGWSWRGWSNGRDKEMDDEEDAWSRRPQWLPFMSKASSTGYWRWGLEEEVGTGALYDDGYQPTKQSARSKTSLITPSYICRCYNKGMVRIYNHCHGVLA